jgi:Collagen triple helix repeat (20 copies)
MFSPLRNRFGIPGAISVIALVFAMLGGAYAASNDGGGKATASAKGKRGPRGPKGPAGPAGPQGPAGAQGAAGAKGDTGALGATGDKGDKGEKGEKGANGTNGVGEDGKSVEEVGGGPSACGGKGGVIYEIEGSGNSTEVCNGAKGEKGEEGEKGDPWSVGGVLPPGETETGAWSFLGDSSETRDIRVSISFPIPLAAPLGPESVHFQNEPGSLEFCSGAPALAKAAPGHLCIYQNPTDTIATSLVTKIFPLIDPEGLIFEEEGASRSGAVLLISPPAEGEISGAGSFAVTAPAAP